MRLRRRDLLGVGAAGGIGWAAYLAGRWRRVPAAGTSPDAVLAATDCTTDGTGAGSYTVRYGPPSYLAAGSRDALHTPPPAAAGGSAGPTQLSVVNTTLEVAAGRNATLWAYNGTVPGPILRVRQGDTLEVRFENHTSAAHSVHFHGTYDVAQDGISRVGPGAVAHYRIEAGTYGLHPYHCHIPPYAQHVSRGMFGALIVDPPEGRPTAHEFVLCLCGFDTDGDGQNDVYAWNGVAGYYDRFPIKVPVGELVRLYVLNMVEHEPVASFHLHAQTFDVIRTGTSLAAHEHTDIVTLGVAERAIIEFRLPRRGRYMFHPHQAHMAERGAMGWIVAI